MKKVFEKMSQIVQICFNNSHRDSFFPSRLYLSERESYYFRALVKREEVSKKDFPSSSQEAIEDQEFLYTPKVAI